MYIGITSLSIKLSYSHLSWFLRGLEIKWAKCLFLSPMIVRVTRPGSDTSRGSSRYLQCAAVNPCRDYSMSPFYFLGSSLCLTLTFQFLQKFIYQIKLLQIYTVIQLYLSLPINFVQIWRVFRFLTSITRYLKLIFWFLRFV